MTPTLHQHLQNHKADVLKGWLKRVNALEKGATRKDHFITAVEEQLTRHMPEVLERLSLEERCFLAECAHQGRLISAREFQARHGSTCPMPKYNYSYREDVSLLEPFIHLPSYRDESEPGLVQPLAESLRNLLPPPSGVSARMIERLPTAWPSEQQSEGGEIIRPVHVFESERIAPAELARVLRLVHSAKIKVTDSSRRTTDATTRLLAEALVLPDLALEMPEEHKDNYDRRWYQPAGAVRAHAWPVLIQQCGWAKAKAGVLTLTTEGKEILQQFTPDKFRAGVNRFIADADFDELNRINHIRGQTGKAKRWMISPSSRKKAITAAMAFWPVGQWLHYDEARRLIEASGQAWDVMENPGGALYFCELQYGGIHDESGISSQFLRAFFMESLATLGVLDLSYIYPHRLWPDLGGLWGTDDLSFCGRYDGLLYVRLNPLGAHAFGLTKTYDYRSEDKPKLFRILPNLDIVLTKDLLNPADCATLELFAVQESDLLWRLEPERVLTHAEMGGSINELRDFLKTNNAEELPANITLLLRELGERASACRSLREAVLLEWSDESLASLIARGPDTHKLCFHAGNNRLVVLKENLNAFGRAIKKMGYALPHR